MKYIDNYIDKEFTISELNISDISKKLKETYLSKGIDVDKVSSFSLTGRNRNYRLSEDEQYHIPYNYESYIMQPLSLLQMKDGSYQLLDGFRRLFCCKHINPSDKGIFYIFQEEDFNEKELVYLLITLNNPKFNMSNGYFTERGVALYFRYNYNIDLLAMTNILYSYMHGEDKEIVWYSKIDTEFSKINTNIIKERLFSDNFLGNLKFISSLVSHFPNIHKVWHIGQFLYNVSKEHHLDFEKINFTKNFIKLEEKNQFDTSGTREVKAYDAIYAEFKNSINNSLGLKITKTFTDLMEEYKTRKLKLDSDKSLKKITEFGYQFYKLVKENGYRKPKLIALVKPEISCDKHFEYEPQCDVIITKLDVTRGHLGVIDYNFSKLEMNNETLKYNGFLNKKGELRVFGNYHKTVWYLVEWLDEKIQMEVEQSLIKK
jgi:hypothetical protein